MKVGLFFVKASNQPGFEKVMSAHVQLPLMTGRSLESEGQEVLYIMPRPPSGQTLPALLEPSHSVRFVSDSSRQADKLTMHHGPIAGVHPLLLVKQLLEIRKIVLEEKLDLLHIFGTEKMFVISAFLRVSGLRIPIILSTEQPLRWKTSTRIRCLSSSVNAILTSTKYVRDSIEQARLDVRVLTHGISNSEFAAPENNFRFRVLFWRDPSWENGADICAEVYEVLAGKYPDVRFTVAVRPHWESSQRLEDVARTHSNVDYFRFPYPEDVTIQSLLNESLCVLLPFRELSVHPQMSVLESLYSGVPVVTSDIASNSELISSDGAGKLIGVAEHHGFIEAVEGYISPHRIEGNDAYSKRAFEAKAQWNWDAYGPEVIGIYESLLDSRHQGNRRI